jgi:replication factor A1
LNIRDLLPGMSNVNMKLKVLGVSEPDQIITGKGVEHKMLELEVGDETGTIKLVLWDDKVIPLKVGDLVQVENGFVSSFKGEWRINVGKYSEVKRI